VAAQKQRHRSGGTSVLQVAVGFAGLLLLKSFDEDIRQSLDLRNQKKKN
jgi:hypothetical protein